MASSSINLLLIISNHELTIHRIQINVSVDYQCGIKGYDSETVKWKKRIEPAMGEGCRVSIPPRGELSPQTPHFSSPEALQTLSFSGFLQRLHDTGMIDEIVD